LTGVGQADKTSTMVNVVVLSASGESRTLKTTAIDAGLVTGAAVAKALRRKQAADRVGTWAWKSGSTLVLWGWREGKAGSENKHELPPPHDELLLFGDAIVVAEGGELTVEEWSAFYDAAFGGFEDLGDSDSDLESEDEDEEDEEEEEDDVVDDVADDVVDDVEAEIEEEESDDDSDSDEDEGDNAVVSEDEAEEEEADDADDDCYDDGDDGGGGKRRAPRRRTAATPECRRIDMGLRSRVKLPTPVGKRAPRWQTTSELEEEAY
jgi:hypothetical protein